MNAKQLVMYGLFDRPTVALRFGLKLTHGGAGRALRGAGAAKE